MTAQDQGEKDLKRDPGKGEVSGLGLQVRVKHVWLKRARMRYYTGSFKGLYKGTIRAPLKGSIRALNP